MSDWTLEPDQWARHRLGKTLEDVFDLIEALAEIPSHTGRRLDGTTRPVRGDRSPEHLKRRVAEKVGDVWAQIEQNIDGLEIGIVPPHDSMNNDPESVWIGSAIATLSQFGRMLSRAALQGLHSTDEATGRSNYELLSDASDSAILALYEIQNRIGDELEPLMTTRRKEVSVLLREREAGHRSMRGVE